jgi:hypothetical protein
MNGWLASIIIEKGLRPTPYGIILIITYAKASRRIEEGKKKRKK